jgi:SAM-dependent methyltransferase
VTEAFEWRGRVGDAWAQEWRRTDRTLAPVGDALVREIAAQVAGLAGPRILDLGCGAGTICLALADMIPGADITGVDLSAALVAAARERAGGRVGLHFEVADAARWAPANGGFDAIVSRHGVMFFDDPVAAFAHVRALGTPGMRLVFSCFRARAENEWAAALGPILERFAPETPAAPPPATGPFAFGDPGHVRAILAAAGFSPPRIAPFDFDFVVGSGDDPVADAVSYFRRIGPFAALLNELDDANAAAAVDQLKGIAAAHVAGGRVLFRAAAWIVSTPAEGQEPS